MSELDNSLKVKISIGDLKDYLRAVYESGVNVGVYIESQPGMGKTETVLDFAAEIELPLYDFRAAIRQPVDVLGVPSVTEDGKTIFNPPAEFLDCPHVFFLDEMPNAPQSMQNALLQLPVERRLGNWACPGGSMIVAAGNRVEDKAGAVRLISNMRDRFLWLEIRPDVEAWASWAWSKGISPEMIQFHRWSAGEGKENLYNFDSARKINPSPRSWVALDGLYKSANMTLHNALFAGLVGEGPSYEFQGFCRIFKHLPDPRTILMNPSSADVPDLSKPDVLYALSGALASHAGEATAGAILEYSERMPGDFGTLLVRDALRVDASGMSNTMAYNEWASRHPELAGAGF